MFTYFRATLNKYLPFSEHTLNTLLTFFRATLNTCLPISDLHTSHCLPIAELHSTHVYLFRATLNTLLTSCRATLNTCIPFSELYPQHIAYLCRATPAELGRAKIPGSIPVAVGSASLSGMSTVSSYEKMLLKGLSDEMDFALEDMHGQF